VRQDTTAEVTPGATGPQHESASAAPARGWLKPLLTPWSRRLAAVAFVGSFFFPVRGLGVDLCPLHAATGLPCPGCGVTRGISALAQGDVALALGANPFSLVVWPALAVLGLSALLAQSRVDALERRLDALEPALSRAVHVGLGAFFGFGLLRLTYVLVSGAWFP
jgi:hypothetical protein